MGVRVAAVAILAASLVPTHAQDTTSSCTMRSMTVSVASGRPASYRLVGWVCSIGSPAGKTVQLLVPGYTYDHTYWDFGYRPERYSYVRAATRAGYATFNIDRLGTGRSGRPPAQDVTVDDHAWVVHQVAQALRKSFRKIVLVGHSLGAGTAQEEASRYHDVDAVILSDWLHAAASYGAPMVPAFSIPAQTERRFASMPAGYTTTAPGTRGTMFHSAGDTDPAVIARDEAMKQTGTVAEEESVFPSFAPSVTQGITAPVLVVTGENDALFCGPASPCTDAATVAERERLFYAPNACLSVFVLPRAGHDINLALNAHDWFSAAFKWLARAPGIDTPRSAGCAHVA
jgi:pimeloyl-ACP methyl ester carboxylesterase